MEKLHIIAIHAHGFKRKVLIQLAVFKKAQNSFFHAHNPYIKRHEQGNQAGLLYESDLLYYGFMPSVEIEQYIQTQQTINKTAPRVGEVPSAVRPLYAEAVRVSIKILEDLYKLPGVQAFILTSAYEDHASLEALKEKIEQKKQEILSMPLSTHEAKKETISDKSRSAPEQPIEELRKQKEPVAEEAKKQIKIYLEEGALRIGERTIRLSQRARPSQRDYSNERLRLFQTLINNTGQWKSPNELWLESFGEEVKFDKDIMRAFRSWADKNLTFRRSRIVNFNRKRGSAAAYAVTDFAVELIENVNEEQSAAEQEVVANKTPKRTEHLSCDEAAVYLLGFIELYKEVLAENGVDIFVLDQEREDVLPEEKARLRTPEELKELRLKSLERIEEFMDDEEILSHTFDTKSECHPLLQITILFLDLDKNFHIQLKQNSGIVVTPLEFIRRLVGAETDLQLTTDREGNIQEIRKRIVIDGFEITKKQGENQHLRCFDPRLDVEMAEILAGKRVVSCTKTPDQALREIKQERIFANKRAPTSRKKSRQLAPEISSRRRIPESHHPPSETRVRKDIKGILKAMYRHGIGSGARREQVQAVYSFITTPYLKGAIEGNVVRRSRVKTADLDSETILRLVLAHRYSHCGWGTKPFMTLVNRNIKEILRHRHP